MYAGVCNREVVYEFVEGSFLPVSLVDETLHCIPDHQESSSHVKTRSLFQTWTISNIQKFDTEERCLAGVGRGMDNYSSSNKPVLSLTRTIRYQ